MALPHFIGLTLLLFCAVLCSRVAAQATGRNLGTAKNDPRAIAGQRFLPGTAIGNEFSGLLTAYGGLNDGFTAAVPSFGVKEGGCGYGLMDKNQWPYWNAVGIRTDSLLLNGITRPRLGCGMCLQITCIDPAHCKTKFPIVVQVTDICPTCEGPMHIDGHVSWVQNFLSVHRANIKAKRVSCVPWQKGIRVAVMNYNGPWLWMRVHFEKLAGRGVVTRVRLQDQQMMAANRWIEMKNHWGTVYEAANSPRSSLVRFAITVDSGEVKMTRFIQLQPWQGGTYDQPGIQFSGGTALPNIQYGGLAWNNCKDVPIDQYSCAQQRSWGKCWEPWMVAKTVSQYGYCAVTCGRCTTSGRKLLQEKTIADEPSETATVDVTEDVVEEQPPQVDAGVEGDVEGLHEEDFEVEEDTSVVINDGDTAAYIQLYPDHPEWYQEFLAAIASANETQTNAPAAG